MWSIATSLNTWNDVYEEIEEQNQETFIEWRDLVGSILTFTHPDTKSVHCTNLSTWKQQILFLQASAKVRIHVLIEAPEKKIIFSLNENRYSIETCYTYRLHQWNKKGNKILSQFSYVENFIPKWFT